MLKTLTTLKKYKNIFLFFFLSITAVVSGAQSSRLVGFVKVQSSGNQLLEGVEIFAFGANTVYSDNHGAFVLEFPKLKPGDIVRNIECSKQGYVVINEEALKAVVIPTKKEDFVLNIVMCRKDEYRVQKSYYYNLVVDNTYKIQDEIRGLNQKLQKLTITDKERFELNEKIKKLESEKLQLEKHSEELSELLVKTDLDQSSELAKKAHELLQKGKLKDAIELLDEEIIIRKINRDIAELKAAKLNLLQKDSAFHQSVDNLILKARFYTLDRQYAAAYKNYLKAISIDPENISYYLEIANFCVGINEIKKAIKYYKEALEQSTNDYQKSQILNKLGYVFTLNAQLPEGEKAINKAIKIQKQLRENGRIQSDFDLAVSYRYLAEVYSDMHKITLSSEYYNKCLSILKSLPQNTNSLTEELAATLNSYGTLLDGQEKHLEAKLYYIQANELYDTLIRIDSIKYLPLWSKVLNNLGTNASSSNDFTEAVKSHLKCLKIRRALVEYDPQKNRPMLANVLLNLGMCYSDLMQYDTAYLYLEESIEIYSDLSRENPNPYRTSLAMAFHSLAYTLYALGSKNESTIYMDSTIRHYEALAEENPELYNSKWRSVYFDLAQIFFEQDSILAAFRQCSYAVKIPLYQTESANKFYEECRLGAIYLFLDSLNHAKQCFTAALELGMRTGDENNQIQLDSFTALIGLSCIASKNGKNGEACNSLILALNLINSDRKFSFTDLMLINRLLTEVKQMKYQSSKLKQLIKELIEYIKIYYSNKMCSSRTATLCDCNNLQANKLCRVFVELVNQLFRDYFKTESKGLNEVHSEPYSEDSLIPPNLTNKINSFDNRYIKPHFKDRLREKTDFQFSIRFEYSNTLNLSGTNSAPMYFENGIMFVSSQGKNGQRSKHTKEALESLYLANFDSDGTLLAPRKFEFNVSKKSNFHKGSVAFTQDYMTAFITSNGDEVLNDEKGNKSFKKIYQLEYGFPDWTGPIDLPFNSDIYSCMHPSLSPDGKWLFFASNMPGGFGDFDLYAVERLGKNIWGNPINLGPAINTEKQELFPYMSYFDTFFFTSDGHPNTLGGMDIYFVNNPLSINEKTDIEIVNLGDPINSPFNDFSFIIDSDGHSGFLASDRNEKNFGKSNIFQFFTPNGIKGIGKSEKNQTIISIKDEKTGQPIQNAEIHIVQTSKNGFNEGNNSLYELDYLPVSNKPNVFRFQLVKKSAKNIGRPDFYSNVEGAVHTELSRYHRYQLIVNREGYASLDRFLAIDSDNKLNLNFKMREVQPCLHAGGILLTSGSNIRIANAAIYFEHLTTGDTVTTRTTRLGEFDICLPRDGDWIIHLEKSGFHSESDSVAIRPGAPFYEEFRLKPLYQGTSDSEAFQLASGLTEGSMFIIDKIFYEYNKATLNQSAIYHLDYIADWMKDYPKMEIDLVAHTDVRGDARINQILTAERAKNAKLYLISKGIAESRINAFGKGETQLLNRCAEGIRCTEDEHLENDRFEVLVKKLEKN